MTLLLSNFANPIHKSQGGLEIGKRVTADDVMPADDDPSRGLLQKIMKVGKVFPVQRWHAAPAGDTGSVRKRKCTHSISGASSEKAELLPAGMGV